MDDVEARTRRSVTDAIRSNGNKIRVGTVIDENEIDSSQSTESICKKHLGIHQVSLFYVLRVVSADNPVFDELTIFSKRFFHNTF